MGESVPEAPKEAVVKEQKSGKVKALSDSIYCIVGLVFLSPNIQCMQSHCLQFPFRSTRI